MSASPPAVSLKERDIRWQVTYCEITWGPHRPQCTVVSALWKAPPKRICWERRATGPSTWKMRPSCHLRWGAHWVLISSLVTKTSTKTFWNSWTEMQASSTFKPGRSLACWLVQLRWQELIWRITSLFLKMTLNLKIHGKTSAWCRPCQVGKGSGRRKQVWPVAYRCHWAWSWTCTQGAPAPVQWYLLLTCTLSEMMNIRCPIQWDRRPSSHSSGGQGTHSWIGRGEGTNSRNLRGDGKDDVRCQTLKELMNLLPQKSVQQFPIIDKYGKQVSVVSIEKVPEKKPDYEDEE